MRPDRPHDEAESTARLNGNDRTFRRNRAVVVAALSLRFFAGEFISCPVNSQWW